MSRPIFEPSLQRADARLNYGQNQLQRRPALTAAGGGGCTCPRPWGYIAWTDGGDIPTADWTDPGDLGGGWTDSFISPDATGLITANLGAGTITGVNTDNGLWRAHAIASWTDTAPANGQLGLRIQPLAAGVPVANPTSEAWADANTVLNYGAIGAMTHDSIHVPTAANITFSSLVFQNSGGNLFLNFLILYIIRDSLVDDSDCSCSQGGSTSYAWIQWGAPTGTVSKSSGSWQTIQDANGGSPDYSSGFESDPNPWSMSVDLSTGVISWTTSGFQEPLVVVNAWAWVADTGWSTGDVLGVCVQLGKSGSFSSSPYWIDTVTIGTETDNIVDDKHLTCSVTVPQGMNRDCARAMIYQSSGGNKSFADTWITATAIAPPDGTFYP